MKDRYTKDVENQNYDLMKRLAEVEEILEDYDKRLKHNNGVCRRVIVDLIDELWYKVSQLHKFKLILEENDIPHHYEDTLQMETDADNMASSYVDEVLANQGNIGQVLGNIGQVFSTDAYNRYEKYIEPHLLNDNTDKENNVDF